MKLLWIDAPHFFAGSEWAYHQGYDEWVCIRAAPIIGWMRGKTGSHVSGWLKRKGYRYGWVG